MTNFLNKALVLFLVLSFGFLNVAKADDLEFYKSFIEKTNLNHEFYSDLAPLDILNSGNRLSTQQKDFLVALSEDLENKTFEDFLLKNDFSQVILFCNSSYQGSFFSCNQESAEFISSLESSSQEIKFQFPETKEISKIFLVNYLDRDFFIVPENFLLSKNQEKMVSEYFTSISRSFATSNTPIDSFSNSYIFIEKFAISPTFELLLYFGFAFLFTSFVYRLILYLKNNFFKINLKELVACFEDMLFGVFKENLYTKALYICFLIFYLLFIFLLFQKYGENTYKYFLELLKLNLLVEIEKSNFKNIFVYIFLNFGFLVILSSRIDVVAEIFRNLFRKISKAEIIPESFKYLFLFFYFCLILSVILFSKFKFTELLILVVLINFYILYFFFKHNLSLRTLFKTKEKIIISIISIGIVLFGFWYDGIEFTSKYRFDNLIGLRDPIVMLPYNKQTTEEVLIDEINEYYNFPLFVDEYLVHYPGIKNIENKNIRDFENNKSSLIVSKSQDRLLKKLVENPNILPSLKYTEKSNIFLAPKISENTNSQDLSLQFTIDCRSLNTTNLIARVYAKDSSGRARVQDIDLGNLLTCNSESKKYTFKVPKNLDLYVDSILDFKDLKPESLLKFEIIDPNNTLYTLNRFSIDFNNLYYFLDFRSEDKENIVAYMTEDNPDYSISSKVAKNTAEIINELKMKKFIKDSFNIWTLEPYQIIKNEYEIKEPLDSELLLNKN